MKDLGLRGARRGKAFKTTIPDIGALRPADLVERQFVATRPDQLWVADITFVATWRGFVFVAFIVDVFSRCIVGWRVSTSMRSNTPHLSVDWFNNRRLLAPIGDMSPAEYEAMYYQEQAQAMAA